MAGALKFQLCCSKFSRVVVNFLFSSPFFCFLVKIWKEKSEIFVIKDDSHRDYAIWCHNS